MKDNGSSNGLKTWLLRDSLQYQLLSRSLLILALVLVVIGAFQYVFMQEVMYRNLALSLQSQVISIPPKVWDHQHEWLESWQASTAHDSDAPEPPPIFIPEVSLVFINSGGEMTLVSNNTPGSIDPPKLDSETYTDAISRNSRFDYLVTSQGGPEQLVVLEPVFFGPGEGRGLVQIAAPTARSNQLLLRQLFTFGILALFAMGLGLLVFIPVLRKTLVPLSNMITTAEQIDSGNLGRRFPTRQGQVEIDRLADSCNGMLERLEASFAAELETKEQMRRFVADASHELRTPLTSIHGFLEVLLRGAATQTDQLEQALKSMHGESQRMNKLVHDLLLLTKLDRTPHVEMFDGCLDKMLDDMEPQLHILAGERRLRMDIEKDIKVRYNPDQMKQVILNLIQNAVQHTDPENGCIQVALKRETDGVQITVQDNGPGISPEHLPHVFDRFYRSDTSRTRKHGGSGLGLAITKSIVEVHGGTIRVVCQEGQGCTFQVWLPG